MARAAFTPEGGANVMRILGAVGGILEAQYTDIWPENHESWIVFSGVSDQWRVGPNGPVAIDLMPVFHELDRMGLDKERYDDLLFDIKHLARAALEKILEKDD